VSIRREYRSAEDIEHREGSNRMIKCCLNLTTLRIEWHANIRILMSLRRYIDASMRNDRLAVIFINVRMPERAAARL
jgi:galactose-1-phosphate uridylyltransferase